MKGMRRYFTIPLLLTLLIVFVVPTVTYAALLCRSDPKLELSNGAKLAIGALMTVDKSQIAHVHYELHVPVGVTITSKVHTPGWQQDLETFTFIDDQPEDSYYVLTTVYTITGDATVIAYIDVKDNGYKESFSALGGEGEAILTVIDMP